MTKVSYIELGNVVPGAVLLTDDKGVNETFIGHIDSGTQRFKAYIKVLNDKQLANELIANTLARILGLPVPRGFLLRANPSDLPESDLLKSFNQEALVFGTQALKHPTLARRFKSDSQEVLKWIKTNFKILDDTIIFDDFVANVDRNQGNLLLGDGGEIWLIDHGHCFTGPNWTAQNLLANQKYNNLMANEFLNSMTLPQRMALKLKANNFEQVLTKIDKKEVMNSCFINSILPSTDSAALEAFIADRVSHIVSIVSERVGIPTLGGSV